MMAMYLLGGSNDVIIEHIEATCSCDYLGIGLIPI